MYLKSLELHGFKSFPDRTVLKFNSGATVIVGPNGSGKSNITDAMRWVLGELSSKSIRGSKMEDVIFAGTDEKKPMSFAEVSVTFDDSAEPRTLDCPYEEVTVTRRYYRSGDSEYFINRKKCRLKDIYDLFLNTGIGREGYSIIGQGRIAEIISKKSEDRRGIFEESAGIARYHYRKTESEKKLAETEANMERVADIENELASRIGPLERDAEKARRYLDLYGEKKKTDVSLWLYDSERMKKAIEKAENDTELSAHELEMAEDSIRVTSGQIERLYEQSHDNKEAERRNYDEIREATRRMSEAESEEKLLLKEKQHAEASLLTEETMLATANRLIETELERLAGIEEKMKQTDAGRTAVRNETDGLETERAALEERIRERSEQIDGLFRDRQNAETELTDCKVRLNVLENSIAAEKQRTETIQTDIRKYQDEIATLDKTADDAQKQIAAYQEAIAGIETEIASLREKAAEKRGSLDEADALFRRKQAESDSLESRINALVRMQEHFDGFNTSVRHVMSEAQEKRLSGIRGPLSTLIRVKNPYIVAIETSLGPALQNIVTDDEGAAKRAIECLKRDNAGRATFYPLTTIRPQERGREADGLEREAGFVSWADELVSCGDEYRNVVRSLLGRVAVFRDLDTAADAARSRNWRLRAVTLDGQQINAGGSFTGGQARHDSGMLSRSAQIDTLRSDLKKVSAELDEMRHRREGLMAEAESIESEISGCEERRSLVEALIGTEQKTFSDADGKRTALADMVANMENDSRTLTESSRDSADDLEKLRDMIREKTETIGSITVRREELASLRGEDELQLNDLNDRIGGCRIRTAELSRDLEAEENNKAETEERIAAARAEAAGHENAAADYRSAIKAQTEAAAEKRKTADELKKNIEVLNERQTTLVNTDDDLETRINALRQTEKEQTGKKELIFTAHTKNEAKLESLRSEDEKLSGRMWDDYELTYAAAVRFAEENDCHVIENGEHTAWVTRQNELKGKIRALGHVNVEAIEEYAEVRKRYDHIKIQLDDLIASKEDLMKILSDIESDMKRLFMEAFVKINVYFDEVFRELFGGGHAEVILSDPEDVLGSGIEINAAPPGKTIKNLNLLSGGEQAFIGIALLFALIRVNPSPFCIFDEIEAALDEVNVNRVARYIKKYSRKMQIVMISHRRGTMDIADTLYGVTMPQNGISKVFTLGSGDDREALLK